ncbi:Hypothetical Protein SLY_0073 [Strawberry lethal yellows phytoplasma (CPA) str. NZSb11]|uniref:Uncharacterized protein n=1 Tax=Strawberry lethal yellows phytoplasma (CPA) str. NZSb11 TaxID=980422 RepID=R4RZP7_PHYAS|nr:Hypothetical Protein SLY_0073 [Strawberry lethal yellows phytoplasma (CPA) str. NZSb11]
MGFIRDFFEDSTGIRGKALTANKKIFFLFYCVFFLTEMIKLR